MSVPSKLTETESGRAHEAVSRHTRANGLGGEWECTTGSLSYPDGSGRADQAMGGIPPWGNIELETTIREVRLTVFSQTKSDLTGIKSEINAQLLSQGHSADGKGLAIFLTI